MNITKISRMMAGMFALQNWKWSDPEHPPVAPAIKENIDRMIDELRQHPDVLYVRSGRILVARDTVSADFGYDDFIVCLELGTVGG